MTWLNGDDSVLDEKDYREGDPKPTTEKIPTKAEDDQNTFVFDKWEETITTDGNTVYRPEFKAVPKPTTTAPAAAAEMPVVTVTTAPTVTPAAAPTATIAPTAAPVITATPIAVPAPTTTPKPVPKTGDRENVFLWSCLMTLCAGILAVTLVLIPSRKRRK